MCVSVRLLLTLLLLLLPGVSRARMPDVLAPAALCDTAITTAGYVEGLPARLLGAIARVESGRRDPVTDRLTPWPWTINAAGIGAFYASKADAIAAVQRLLARGVRSIDVGCMQVNLMFHPKAFASLDEAFDPRANALYAARFLSALRAGSRDWPQAVGAYHSQTPVLGEDYRHRVLALWRDPGLVARGLSLAAAYQDFAPHSQIYGDFAQHGMAYGAFAMRNPALTGVPRR